MTPYHYQPLDNEAEYIRLLYLLPAEPSTDIRVDLVHTRLTKEDVPKYEALSYAWGESDTPEVINVGQEGDVTLAVTRSLFQALPYLRYRDKRRVLWVDAICVDQQNLKERSHQVQRMGDVFCLADQVIVWLGVDDTTSTHAIQLLHSIASRTEVDWITSTVKPISRDDVDWADILDARSYRGQDMFAIYSLVMRPWFERLWVQQEIHSKRNAILVCGFDTLSWHDFRKAVFCIASKLEPIEDDETLYPGMAARFMLILNMISEGGFFTLGALIETTQQCKCSDPRDRVYAVLNMLTTFERYANIKPDYTKTVGQVYRDVVLSILECTGKIIILGHCEMQEQPLESSDSLQIPSWVPDWRFPRHTRQMGAEYASCDSSAEASNENDVLRVMGTYVARISHVEKISCDSMPSLMSAIQGFSQNILPDVTSASYVSGGSKLDAYCRTLCVNFFASEYLPPLALMSGYQMPGYQESREWLSSILSPPETDMEIDSNVASGYEPYLRWVGYYTRGMSLFTTEEGHIGLAPAAAKLGDRVCVLLGSSAPFILRPTRDKQYEVVGHCYTHGIMGGEALLGPLPGDYRRVHGFHSKGNCYAPAFHSAEKGIIQFNDPRVPNEPVYEYGNSEELLEWVVNEERALTSEALKKRGVHMEMFELI